jgi:hypothetical protein
MSLKPLFFSFQCKYNDETLSTIHTGHTMIPIFLDNFDLSNPANNYKFHYKQEFGRIWTIWDLTT